MLRAVRGLFDFLVATSLRPCCRNTDQCLRYILSYMRVGQRMKAGAVHVRLHTSECKGSRDGAALAALTGSGLGWLNGLKHGMAHLQSRAIGNPKRKEQEPRIEQRILRLWPVLACMIVIRGGDGDESMKIQCHCGMGIKRKSHHCPAEGLSGSWFRAISKQKTRAGALEVHCTLSRLAPSGVGDWPRVRDCCRCYLTYKTWLPRRTHIPLAASTGERTSCRRYLSQQHEQEVHGF